jgi:hypothetical protein
MEKWKGNYYKMIEEASSTYAHLIFHNLYQILNNKIRKYDYYVHISLLCYIIKKNIMFNYELNSMLFKIQTISR